MTEVSLCLGRPDSRFHQCPDYLLQILPTMTSTTQSAEYNLERVLDDPVVNLYQQRVGQNKRALFGANRDSLEE